MPVCHTLGLCREQPAPSTEVAPKQGASLNHPELLHLLQERESMTHHTGLRETWERTRGATRASEGAALSHS